MKILNNNLHLFCLSLLVGCAGAKPLISNLENGTYGYATLDSPKNILEVSVSILPIEKSPTTPEKPKTFFDLRDSLPHIFLKIMADKIKDPNELIAVLSKPLSTIASKPPESKQRDYTSINVQFAFSNIKQYYNNEKFMHPNTRLEFLTTTLSIPDPKSTVTFYNIDRLKNEYDDIDLGSLSRDQTVSLNAKLSAQGGLGSTYSNTNNDTNSTTSNNQNGKVKSVYDADGNVLGTMNNSGTFTSSKQNNNSNTSTAQANVTANGEISYLNSQIIKEAVAVKLQRLKTGFIFSPSAITIAQRGRPLGDISDNVYVTTTLKISDPKAAASLHVYSFNNLYDKDNMPNKAEKLDFSPRTVDFIRCDAANNVTLNTYFEGAIRAVGNEIKNPGTNALEYDDKITFYKIGKTDGKTLTIDKNLYCRNAFRFIASDTLGAKYILMIKTSTTEQLSIFADDNPGQMREWIIDNVMNPDAAHLSANTFELYLKKITPPNNLIYIVKKQMTPTDITKLKIIDWNSLNTEKTQ